MYMSVHVVCCCIYIYCMLIYVFQALKDNCVELKKHQIQCVLANCQVYIHVHVCTK